MNVYVHGIPSRQRILTAKSEINSLFMSRLKVAQLQLSFQTFLSVQLNEDFSSGAEISGEAVCSDLDS